MYATLADGTAAKKHANAVDRYVEHVAGSSQDSPSENQCAHMDIVIAVTVAILATEKQSNCLPYT